MLSLNSLNISTTKQELINNLSISILPSSIIYLKGPNGSGKTSLLRVLAGIQSPTSGSISFGKQNLPIENLKKPYCVYVGHNAGIKQDLNVYQNLKFWSKIYQSPELLDASIYYFGLNEILYKKCYELSAGNLKKVALSRLLSCNSNLWLLDEVDSNLDENNKKLLNNIIVSKANNGGIIFISTHNEPLTKSAIILDIDKY